VGLSRKLDVFFADSSFDGAQPYSPSTAHGFAALPRAALGYVLPGV
jgi:hypothetical protein